MATEKQSVFVLPEGVIEITMDHNGLSITEILRDDASISQEAFVSFMKDGHAKGTVSLSNGNSGKINLHLEGVLLITPQILNNNSQLPVKSGEDYNEMRIMRTMMTMIRFILIETDNWFIWGNVMSGSRKTPIFMVYSNTIKKCFYSMKRKTDYLPISFNPNLN